MKNNKKGFTLIELLAVIVILAIIALIAVPTIMNIINKANKSAFKDSAYGIINAGELYYAQQQLELNGMEKDKIFDLAEDVNVEGGLQLKGEVPETGTLIVNTEGQTTLAISNGRYCITKRYTDQDITVTEDYETCDLPEMTLSDLAITSATLGVASVNSCVEKGEVCEVSKTDPIAFAIKVNAEETYKFYVLNDDGEKITLIMHQNLYEDGNNTNPNVAWISATDYATENNKEATPTSCSYDSCTDEGPITAINTLKSRTNDWKYITEQSYTYSGLAEDEKTMMYEDITETMRARMLTYNEAASNGCIAEDESCPGWLWDNLLNTGDDNTMGYWTPTAYSGFYNFTWYVSYAGRPSSARVYILDKVGVRPVIELSK